MMSAVLLEENNFWFLLNTFIDIQTSKNLKQMDINAHTLAHSLLEKWHKTPTSYHDNH